MPKLSLETEAAVSLEPKLAARLHSSLTQYTGIREQIAMLEDMADVEKARMWAILDEAGASKTEQDGFSVSIVRGTNSKLDPKKLVALGVGEAMLQSATTITPKKPYLLVRKTGSGE